MTEVFSTKNMSYVNTEPNIKVNVLLRYTPGGNNDVIIRVNSIALFKWKIEVKTIDTKAAVRCTNTLVIRRFQCGLSLPATDNWASLGEIDNWVIKNNWFQAACLTNGYAL